MKHPLSNFKIQANSIKCFDKSGSGFFSFSPVTIIIGKNNSGKSTIIDIIDIAIKIHPEMKLRSSQTRRSEYPTIDIKTKLDEKQLRNLFSDKQTGGIINGNHWMFAKSILHSDLIWKYSRDEKKELISIDNYDSEISQLHQKAKEKISQSDTWAASMLPCRLLRVAAERSVQPEVSTEPAPKPTGEGITNLIRYFINSDAQPRDAVEIELLDDLNKIYLGDSQFVSIVCQENDSTNLWEIFLREEEKGDIRLSEYGSSLQSIFIILSYLKLVPMIEEIEWTSLILAIEEPENNLHPSLLRRLIGFLAERRHELGFSLLFTSHSPICIDWSSHRDDAGILHVRREEGVSKCRNVLNHFGRATILDDLDVRGSDMLQSNGIIWVEGPSDRIYIRRWLHVITQGKLTEGAHFTFMFYGGKVLNHFDASPPEELPEKLQMLSINRNIAVIMDSDRAPYSTTTKTGKKRKPRLNLNKSKRLIIEEIERCDGFSWVTSGKEIENYVSNEVWETVCGGRVRIPHEYIDIPNLPQVRKVSSTKVELAHLVEPHINLDNIRGTLDLEAKVNELAKRIGRWNSI